MEAEPFFPEDSGPMIALIGKLYAMEREVPRAGPEAEGEARREAQALRLTLRRERSKPVVREIQTLFETAKLCGEEPKAYVRRAALNAIRTPGAITLPEALKD